LLESGAPGVLGTQGVNNKKDFSMTPVDQTARVPDLQLIRGFWRRSVELFALTALLAFASQAQAGMQASLSIVDLKPLKTFSAVPVTIAVAFDGAVEVSTLHVELNGAYVTSRFVRQGNRAVGSLSLADGTEQRFKPSCCHR
jgi:hypothetical protein